MPAKKKLVEYDIVTEPGELQERPQVATARLLEKLGQKGFCVIDPAQDSFKAVLDEVADLEKATKLEAPPPQIVDGLLGQEGSASFYELEKDGYGEGLERVDKLLATVASLVGPLAPGAFGFRVQSRSATTVHVSGEYSEALAPPLTEAVADRWLSTFSAMRLMVLLFLGPEQAMLEMVPQGVESVAPLEVVTEPGMLVVLRPDILSHRVFSDRPSTTVTCFLQDVGASRPVPGVSAKIALELDDWCQARMQQLKDMEVIGEDGPRWDSQIPRHWQAMMNRTYYKGPQAATRSVACQFPTTWDNDEFFGAHLAGTDAATEVPLGRWDVKETYDADPNSFNWAKSYSKHGTFMEGVELFDPKPFGLSVFESKGMDPCQRHILEVAYEALRRAQYSKKQLMKALIGMYIGAMVPAEFQMAPISADLGGSGTSAAGAIVSNRISFCLGLQGPSFTLDAHGAAGLTAVSCAVNSIRHQTDRYKPNTAGVAGSVALTLAPNYYVLSCAAGWLCPEGRCFTFDATAQGYCKGEGCGAAVFDALAEEVDGAMIENDSAPNLGVMVSVAMNHSGRSAGLRAPNGPQERELVEKALLQAAISVLDVDAVETAGDGGLLCDAVEVTSLNATLRPEDEPGEEPLFLACGKTGFGFGMECAGMVQLIKILSSQRLATQAPTLHVQEISPHIEVWDDQRVSFLTEMMPYKYGSSFVGMTSKGVGGTMCHAMPWGLLADRLQKDPAVTAAKTSLDPVVFWPGGGGELEDEVVPSRTYNIVGSWSSFETAHTMEPEGDGVYTYTVTLGINRFEHFQVWLDGKSTKVLHPDFPSGTKNARICGPTEESKCQYLQWQIDGRPFPGRIRPPGFPGEKYLVKLSVSGRWRTLEWEKIEGALTDTAATPYEDDGTYYIVGPGNDFAFTDEMKPVDGSPGLFRGQLKVARGDAFQIVRNRDWNQTFYPGGEADKVAGPDWGDGCGSWSLNGKAGDTYEISFERRMTAPGEEERKITWKKL